MMDDNLTTGASKFLVEIDESTLQVKRANVDNLLESHTINDVPVFVKECKICEDDKYKARLKYEYKENVIIECFQSIAPAFYLPTEGFESVYDSISKGVEYAKKYNDMFVENLDNYLNKLCNNDGIMIINFAWGTLINSSNFFVV